jgi:hypothetical protein
MAKHKQRTKLFIPPALVRAVRSYQKREEIPAFSQACVRMMREGARRVGVMGGKKQ